MSRKGRSHLLESLTLAVLILQISSLQEVITLAPKKLILTRRASEGSASEPSLARRVSMCKDAKLSCRGNSVGADSRCPMSMQKAEKRSHADQDHYSALPDLLDRFQIGELVIPSGFVNEQNPGASLLLDQFRARGIPVRTIAAPLAWDQAGVHFAVPHPPVNWHPETPDNARSLVLDAEYEGRHFLLTGNLDQLGLSELVSGPQPDPSIELMFSPHHGGKSANPSWLYSWARPRTVVVSQRPTAPGTTDALTPLERAGTPVLRTWQRGAIHFRWTPDGIITQGFLDLNGCRSLPAWPTGEGASSRRVFAMLLSSPCMGTPRHCRAHRHQPGRLPAGRHRLRAAGDHRVRCLGPGRAAPAAACDGGPVRGEAQPPAIRWIDPGQSRPLPLTA